MNLQMPEMDGYLSKPIRQKELDAMLENVVAHRTQALSKVNDAEEFTP